MGVKAGGYWELLGPGEGGGGGGYQELLGPGEGGGGAGGPVLGAAGATGRGWGMGVLGAAGPWGGGVLSLPLLLYHQNTLQRLSHPDLASHPSRPPHQPQIGSYAANAVKHHVRPYKLRG